MRAKCAGSAATAVDASHGYMFIKHPDKGELTLAGGLRAAESCDLLMVTWHPGYDAEVPVIDRCYPLGELPEAMRYLEGLA